MRALSPSPVLPAPTEPGVPQGRRSTETSCWATPVPTTACGREKPGPSSPSGPFSPWSGCKNKEILKEDTAALIARLCSSLPCLLQDHSLPQSLAPSALEFPAEPQAMEVEPHLTISQHLTSVLKAQRRETSSRAWDVGRQL